MVEATMARSKSLSGPLTKLERADASLESPDEQRPRTRGECQDGPRPCPWVGCRHHLYLDVNEIGSMKLNFPGVEIEDMRDTCSLDVADRGERTLNDIGDRTNLTRERIRQIESKILVKLRRPLRPLR